jgi:hypothetical protein
MVSIKTKIEAAILLTVLISALSVTYAVFITVSNLMENHAFYHLEEEANFEATKIELKNNKVESAVSSIESMIPPDFNISKYVDNPQELNSFLENMAPMLASITEKTEGVVGSYAIFNVEIFKGVHQIWYVHDNGTFIRQTEFEPLESFQQTDPAFEWYFVPLMTGKEHWTGLYDDFILGIKMASYVQPVTRAGTVVAVVGIDVSFDEIQKEVRNIRPYDSGHAFMLDSNGEFLVQPPEEHNTTQINALVSSVSKEKTSGVIVSGDEFYGFSKLSDEYTLVLLADKEAVLAPVYKLNRHLLKIMTIIILISLIIGYAVSHSITRNITRLASYLNIQPDDQKEFTDIHSGDEIEMLSRQFKKMTAEIRKSRQNLEHLVLERTKELNQKISQLSDTNRVMIGRELKMIELKKKIKELQEQAKR